MNTSINAEHWFKHHIPVLQDSRWIRLFKKELQVWRVVGFGVTIKNKTADVVSYILVRDDIETDDVVESPYEKVQKAIRENTLINIGQYTKEEWIEMSKPKN